ncbi:hypothetical protein [Phaeobacter sp.]|uniref:hypothetical protein n=1 Tax=Phaeobacter sp. TaxID=1902409 RepID=UPI0025F6CFD9|nr:hypothetical protein [Phaeobacter sp.]
MTEPIKTVNSIVFTAEPRHTADMMTVATRTALFASLLGLLSCGPVPVYWQEDVSVQKRDRDLLSCEVNALKDAPVAIEQRQRPPVFRQGPVICHAGTCARAPGYWADGAIYSVDVNKPLRSRLEQSCMAAKGYAEITLPRCARQRLDGAIRPERLSALSETSCAVPQTNAQPVILP